MYIGKQWEMRLENRLEPNSKGPKLKNLSDITVKFSRLFSLLNLSYFILWKFKMCIHYIKLIVFLFFFWHPLKAGKIVNNQLIISNRDYLFISSVQENKENFQGYFNF